MGRGRRPDSLAAEPGACLEREAAEPSSCTSLRTGELERRVEGVGDSSGH